MKKSTLDFIAKARPAAIFIRDNWKTIQKYWPFVRDNWKPLGVCAVILLLIAAILFGIS